MNEKYFFFQKTAMFYFEALRSFFTKACGEFIVNLKQPLNFCLVKNDDKTFEIKELQFFEFLCNILHFFLAQ